MTRTPRTRAATPPAARGSVSDADLAGTLQPPSGVPAQTSRPSRAPRLPGTGGTPGPETGGHPSDRGQSPVRARAETPAGASGTDSPPAGSTTGRTFTITLPTGLELLSLNDRLHWRERHRRYQCIKFAAYVTARDAKIPPLGRARIVVEYQPPDLRHRDADNPMAAAKAAVDGVVLAGCLADDECPRYVTGIWATIGPVYPKGRLVLHLTEVPA